VSLNKTASLDFHTLALLPEHCRAKGSRGLYDFVAFDVEFISS